MTFFYPLSKKSLRSLDRIVFSSASPKRCSCRGGDGRLQVLCACLVLKKCKTIPCWRKTFFILEKKVILEVFLHDNFSAFVSSGASLHYDFVMAQFSARLTREVYFSPINVNSRVKLTSGHPNGQAAQNKGS